MPLHYKTPYPVSSTGISSKTRQRLLPYSYIVQEQDGIIYADEANGTSTNYRGTDASTVIQSALNALTSGRTWKEQLILKGEFSIASTILIPSYTILDLYQAKLSLADNANCDMCKLANDSADVLDIYVLGGYLYGNKTRNTTGNGIVDAVLNTRHVYDCIFQDIHIDSFPEHGMKFGRIGAQSQLVRNRIEKNALNGIYIVYDTDSVKSERNEIYFNEWDGIRIDTGVLFRDFGSRIVANYRNGIAVAVSESLFIGTEVTDNSRESTAGSGTYSNFEIRPENNYLIGCQCRSEYSPPYPKYDYREQLNTGVPNHVIGFKAHGSSLGLLCYDYKYFIDVVVKTYNGVWSSELFTENHGTATILNLATTVVVNHGLVDTPTNIKLTGLDSEVSAPWITNAGATQFTINIAGAVTADRDVYWYAEV